MKAVSDRASAITTTTDWQYGAEVAEGMESKDHGSREEEKLAEWGQTLRFHIGFVRFRVLSVPVLRGKSLRAPPPPAGLTRK